MTEWRRISTPCYRNYEVSDDGRVRRGGRELGGYVDRYGYRTVLLYYAGLSKRFKVHRLVCFAFVGEGGHGQEVCHINGDPRDNRAANLRWGTRSENVQDAIRHGTHRHGTPPPETMSRGSAHYFAKLTESLVREARQRHAAGESGRSLAAVFGVTSANMSAALRGKTWSHVSHADAPVTPCNPHNRGQDNG